LNFLLDFQLTLRKRLFTVAAMPNATHALQLCGPVIGATKLLAPPLRTSQAARRPSPSLDRLSGSTASNVVQR